MFSGSAHGHDNPFHSHSTQSVGEMARIAECTQKNDKLLMKFCYTVDYKIHPNLRVLKCKKEIYFRT